MQPWAGKVAAPTELTEEQKEYIAKLDAEREAKQGSKKQADAVRAALHCTVVRRRACWLACAEVCISARCRALAV